MASSKILQGDRKRGKKPAKAAATSPPATTVQTKRPSEKERAKAGKTLRRAASRLMASSSHRDSFRQTRLRELLKEFAKNSPSMAVADSNLTELLMLVSFEFIRRYYPNAGSANLYIHEPFGDTGKYDPSTTISLPVKLFSWEGRA
jgi:hypothetical protein